MSEAVLAVLIVLFVWWFATGAILWLDGLPRRTFRTTGIWSTAALLAACGGIYLTADTATATGAVVAFLCAIVVWGWNEILFLMGWVTGSRRGPADPAATGLTRFVQAAQTLTYHELVLVASGVVIVALAWDGSNQVAAATFGALWVMRLSTKLNIHLGIPNVTEEFLPAHLDYLKSYFRRRVMNPFFPVSVTVSTLAVIVVAQWALDHPAGSFEAVAGMLIATLIALGVLEHWFLILPFSVADLWSSWLRGRKAHADEAAHHPAGPAGPDEIVRAAAPSGR